MVRRRPPTSASSGRGAKVFAGGVAFAVAAIPVVARAQATRGVDKPAGVHANTTKDATPSATSAPSVVERARALFEDQRYEESVQVLTATLARPNPPREERILALHLLFLNMITLQRTDEAESAVRGLLALAPDYKLEETSPRFVTFFEKVRAAWIAEGRPGLTVAPRPSVTIRHVSPSKADPQAALPIAATLEGGAGVRKVRLFFRSPARGPFTSIDLEVRDGRAAANIPSSAVLPPLLEYYLEAIDDDGLVVGSRGEATAPMRVAVPEKGSGWVLPLAIGGGVLGAAAIVGALALAGVFSSEQAKNPGPAPMGTVNVSVGETRFAW